MSLTPGPYARPSRMANGLSATVPGSKTVSVWPMSKTVGPPGDPSNVPTMVSPKSRLACRTTDAPSSASRVATQVATSSTPALVYVPQSTSTSRCKSSR